MIERIVVAEDSTNVENKTTSKLSFADRLFGILGMKRVEPEPKKRINRKAWKEWEITFMKEEYPDMSIEQIAVYLKRPYSTVYDNMRKHGIIKKKD